MRLNTIPVLIGAGFSVRVTASPVWSALPLIETSRARVRCFIECRTVSEAAAAERKSGYARSRRRRYWLSLVLQRGASVSEAQHACAGRLATSVEPYDKPPCLNAIRFYGASWEEFSSHFSRGFLGCGRFFP